VTPEATDYLDKARKALSEAQAVAAIQLPEAAGRAAYLAAYHAAQAFIFHQTGKIAKTHSGVRSEFSRLTKDNPLVNRAFPTFLGQAYNLKAIADYGVGSEGGVSLEEADEAILKAAHFVDGIAALLTEPLPKETL
jgi:uncharacterized protein (UPF0332 family)